MKTNILRLFCCAIILAAATASAQTSKEEVLSDINRTGGVYYAYPVTESLNTPPPKGYRPFYISHYGRHGSRYLISDSDYTGIAALLHKAAEAGALTPLGRDVMERVDSVIKEADRRGGDLSPLGVRQHRGIAERMVKAFPEVFAADAEISARSTTVVRCVLSMDAFCERLKELNPRLKTTREASGRYMDYLNHHSPESNEFTGKNGFWHEEYRKFEQRHTHPERLVASIFSDSRFVDRYVNPNGFMWSLYWLASGMQDIETQLSFYDLFSPDELFDLWQCFNYRFYVCDANYAGNRGMMLANATPLVNNIVESAENAMASDKPSATLRFGHDGNLIPLAGRLGLEDCYASVENPEDFFKVFSDWKIAPMAGNVQIVFFRRPGKSSPDDVIVKFMLNEREKAIPVETDIFPFYHWPDVKRYLLHEAPSAGEGRQ